MSLIPNPSNALSPVTSSAVKEAARSGLYDDRSALSLVISSTEFIEQSQSSKDWCTQWAYSLRLYQSQTASQNWGNGTARNNFPQFMVRTAAKSFVPQITNELFAEDPPFLIKNRPGTDYHVARAVSAVLNYQLEDIGFRKEFTDFVMNMGLFGTGIAKWGWEEYTEKRSKYVLVDTSVNQTNAMGQSVSFQNESEPSYLDTEEEEVIVSRPIFENIVNLKHVLVDNTLNVSDIRKAKNVIHKMYMNYRDLERLRDQPGYDLPSFDTVVSWFMPDNPEQPIQGNDADMMGTGGYNMQADPAWMKASTDALTQPLEVLEYWTNDNVITVLQRKLVIRNVENPYGVIPFLSCNFDNVPGTFYGVGIGKLVGGEQRLQQGILNAWLDMILLAINPMYIREKGTNNSTQNILSSPGNVVSVEDIAKFQMMPRPPGVPEAEINIGMSNSRIESMIGSSAVMSGVAGSSGHSNQARTAAGVAQLGLGAMTAISEMLDSLAQQVFIPFLEQMIEMDRLMPSEVWNRILSEADKPDNVQLPKGQQNPPEAEGDPKFEDLVNANVRFDVKAGTKMKEKIAALQSLPMISQVLLQSSVEQMLAVQGMTIDIVELVRMWLVATGWNNNKNLIRPMTPQENQRFVAMSPAAQVQAQLMAKKNMQDSKFEHEKDTVDQKQQGQLARTIVQTELKHEKDTDRDWNKEQLDRAAGELDRAQFRQTASGPALTGQPSLGTNATGNF